MKQKPCSSSDETQESTLSSKGGNTGTAHCTHIACYHPQGGNPHLWITHMGQTCRNSYFICFVCLCGQIPKHNYLYLPCKFQYIAFVWGSIIHLGFSLQFRGAIKLMDFA